MMQEWDDVGLVSRPQQQENKQTRFKQTSSSASQVAGEQSSHLSPVVGAKSFSGALQKVTLTNAFNRLRCGVVDVDLALLDKLIELVPIRGAPTRCSLLLA